MKSLQGHLLVAAPSFVGAPLPRAVVLVTEHTENQATGVVLNHPVNEQILRSCLEMWQAGKTPAVALKMIQPQIPELEIQRADNSDSDAVNLEQKDPADRCKKQDHCSGRRKDEVHPENNIADPALPETPSVDPLKAVDAMESNSINVGEGFPLAAIPQPVQIPVGVLMAPNNIFGGRLTAKSPPLFRVVVGQVAWNTVDLQAQLDLGQWLTTPATPDLLFAAHEDLWKFAVQRVGAEVLNQSLGIVPRVPSELN